MSSIPLAVQTPQPQSPLASIGQLLSTKDMASQIALRQAQTQQAQAAAADQAAQAAARQRQVKDIQTVQTSLNDPNHPEYATAWGKGDLSFLNGKIDPTTQLSLQTAHTKLLQDNAGLATSTIKNKQDAWGQAGETLAGLQHLYDQSEAKAPGSGAAAVAAAYPDAVGQLRQLPGLQDVNIPPAIDGTQNSLAQLAAHANSTKAFYDTVAAQKEAASKAQKEAADAAVSNAVASNLSPTGLTPEQQVQQKQAEATLAATQAQRLETARHNQVSESTARFEAGTQAQRAAAETALASGAQGDREIASLTRPHQTVVSSGQSQLQNLTEAQQLLSTDNAQAQTLAVPKILAAVSGGSGSGLRMTMAEMNNIVKGRGWRGDATAFLQKIQSGESGESGESLTPEEVKQERGILSDLQGRIRQKVQIASDTINQIQNAPDRQSRYAAAQAGQQHLNMLSGIAPPEVQSLLGNASVKPGIHKLSDGSTWVKGEDGSITPQ